MTNKFNETLFTEPDQNKQGQNPQNRKVWVVPFSRKRLASQPMKTDSYGYDDWEIYHG